MSIISRESIEINNLSDISRQSIEMESIIIALLPNTSIDLNLTVAEIEFISKFLNDGSQNPILLQIQQSINAIINDNKIDLKDLPHLVMLVSHIIKIKSDKNLNMLSIIKYILDSLLKSNILPIPDELKDDAQYVIDTSIFLLGTSVEVSFPKIESKIYSFFNCLFNIFKKK